MTVAASLALWVLVGFAFGVGYFFSLERIVALYLRGVPRGRVAALQVARITAAVAVFVLVARAGAAPLFAAFGGFLGGRFAVLHYTRGERA